MWRTFAFCLLVSWLTEFSHWIEEQVKYFDGIKDYEWVHFWVKVPMEYQTVGRSSEHRSTANHTVHQYIPPHWSIQLLHCTFDLSPQMCFHSNSYWTYQALTWVCCHCHGAAPSLPWLQGGVCFVCRDVLSNSISQLRLRWELEEHKERGDSNWKAAELILCPPLLSFLLCRSLLYLCAHLCLPT